MNSVRVAVAGIYTDLWLHKGGTIQVEFSVLNEDNLPFNLTGWNVRFTVSPQIVKTSVSAEEIEITNRVGGVGILHLIPSDTLLLYDGMYWVFEIYNTEEVFPFVTGYIRTVGAPQ